MRVNQIFDYGMAATHGSVQVVAYYTTLIFSQFADENVLQANVFPSTSFRQFMNKYKASLSEMCLRANRKKEDEDRRWVNGLVLVLNSQIFGYCCTSTTKIDRNRTK